MRPRSTTSTTCCAASRITRRRTSSAARRCSSWNATARRSPRYEQALAFDPTLGAAWSQRGGLLRDQHRLDEAAISFEQAIANGADPELNRYFLASVTGRGAPAAAPLAYVEPFFDEYADAFEGHLLGGLHYEAHTTLVHGLHGLEIKHFRAALDLGCGTGLCGPLVAPMVDHLDGVDLSRNMLEKARRLGVYRHLVHAEIAEHLRRTDERYDLVLSADVFIYIGDLEAVFEGLRRVVDRERHRRLLGRGRRRRPHVPVAAEPALRALGALPARPGDAAWLHAVPVPAPTAARRSAPAGAGALRLPAEGPDAQPSGGRSGSGDVETSRSRGAERSPPDVRRRPGQRSCTRSTPSLWTILPPTTVSTERSDFSDSSGTEK